MPKDKLIITEAIMNKNPAIKEKKEIIIPIKSEIITK
tara:strand:- start:942 stop:1052 length:111 start_codon:yes stop_codon:yes gene_type:complete